MLNLLLAASLAGFAPQTPLPAYPIGGGRTGGTTQPLGEQLTFAEEPAIAKFAPFADASGAPLNGLSAAAGAADFDGDGHRDLWFLGAATPNVGAVSVQMARASSLGRYRPWYVETPQSWVAATSYHPMPGAPQDELLLVDPANPKLMRFFYSTMNQAFGRSASGWDIGLGAFEVATYDDGGDGYDVVVGLLSPSAGSTRIVKLRMAAPLGWVQPIGTASLDLPVPTERLRLFDYDGDGLADALVVVPGLGLAVLRDDGQGWSIATAITLGLPPLDVFTGDVNRDGRADFGAVYPDGVVIWLSQTAGFSPVALWRPATAATFGGARILENDSSNLSAVVALAADGREIVIFPSLPGMLFGPAQLRQPPDTTAYPGAGPGLRQLIVTDVDADGDQDVVAQMPDQQHWVHLLGGEYDQRPQNPIVADLGMVYIGQKVYRHDQLTVRLPFDPTATTDDQVELALFVEDTLPPFRFHYWGRSISDIDPNTRTATFSIYTAANKTTLNSMLLNRTVFEGKNITAGGNTLLSVHLLAPTDPVTGARRRSASTFLNWDDGGDPQKSALGVTWKVSAAPPRADADDDLLPWN